MKKWLKMNSRKAQIAVVATGTALMSGAASAVDTAAVQTAIAAAESDALTTGEYVIGTVASLVVITLIVGIIKKL